MNCGQGPDWHEARIFSFTGSKPSALIGSAMRLLFVKLKHIGDALLLTPTLQAVRKFHPKSEIWVVVRKGTEDILRGCAAIDRVLVAASPEAGKRSFASPWLDFKRVLELRERRFDYAFELTDGDRGRWFAGFSGAGKRCANTSFYPLNFWWRLWINGQSRHEWTQGHRVEKDFFTVRDFLSIGNSPPPMIFDPSRTARWDGVEAGTSFAVLHPGTRWRRKRWSNDRWLQVGRFLLDRVHRLVISTGPDAEETDNAARFVADLGPRAISTGGTLTWAHLAGLLHRAKLFVGVDTAAMHLAAACQCPIVALFGPSSVTQWAPWKVPHEIVAPLAGSSDAKLAEEALMAAIDAERVIQACGRMLR